MNPMPIATAQPLPTLADRPGADVLIYDGHCGICTSQVARLARWDSRGSLAFVSLHDPLVSQRYPDLSHEQLMQNMYVVDQQGGRHRGAAAFRYLSRQIPRLWWLAPLLHLPGCMPLWQWMYRQVADRRYALSDAAACDGGSCSLHRKK